MQNDISLLEQKIQLIDEKIASLQRLIGEFQDRRQDLFRQLEIAQEETFLLEKIKTALFSQQFESEATLESSSQYIADPLLNSEEDEPSQGEGIVFERDGNLEIAILRLFDYDPQKILSYQFLQLKLDVNRSQLNRAIASLLGSRLVEDKNNPRHYQLKKLRKGNTKQYKHLPYSYLFVEENITEALVKVILTIEGLFPVRGLINLLYSSEQQQTWSKRQDTDIKHTLLQFLSWGMRKGKWQRVATGKYQNF